MNSDAVEKCYDAIHAHSKSFSVASRLLPVVTRNRAVIVYAWCRRADDAVDGAPNGATRTALDNLRRELDDVYAGRETVAPVLGVFQRTIEERRIPRRYPDDLLEGMEMDVSGTRYDNMDTLLHYCYCVAGTVGLMMCHVMGVADENATRNAVHMGMAMQMTNICRDVYEDWQRGRLYIPGDLLAECGCGDLASDLGSPFPDSARKGVARATRHLLEEADRFYQSGDTGVTALSWRCALAVRTARRVYSSIGDRVRGAGCDPLAGRAIVPATRKLSLVARSLADSFVDAPRRAAARSAVFVPRRQVEFPGDVLPI